MGNASSSQTASSSSTSPAAPSATQDASSSSRTTVPAPQPISTSRPAVPTSSAFHSGLTPPVSPPSPPPPGTPMLMPFAGHLTPQNPHCLSHPQAHDYSKSTVTKLILDGKLAPFYRGLEDFEEDWTIEDIGRILTETREKDYEDGIENSYIERLKEEREGGPSTVGSVAKKMGINRQKEMRKEAEKEERVRREKRTYQNALECPICFLNYPPNINTSRCCQQPVCTECFVQMKRSEATITHLESDPACCPFCMETDFGVIYERPVGPIDSSSSIALATSPGSEADVSGFSQALSLGSEAELSVGPGMNPKMKETVRRKSVSSKAQEVVTIDEIRPDWEHKLNSVKAAAARRASRRIVMRQVGDRLIPIGFTSSRAPGTADFSMSVGQQQGNEQPRMGSRRSSRRESNRERELEELMIMEAMRLSLVDHEDHQRKMADDRRNSSASNVSSPLNPANASVSSTTGGPSYVIAPSPSYAQPAAPSSPAPSFRRSSNANDKPSGASKLFSKITNARARANSAASTKSVTFASSTSTTPPPVPPLPTSSPGTASASTSASASPPMPTSRPISARPIQTYGLGPNSAHGKSPSSGTGLSPTSPAPVAVAPVTTLASPVADRRGQHPHSGSNTNANTYSSVDDSPTSATTTSSSTTGLPRLSLDMPALTPAPAHTPAHDQYRPTSSNVQGDFDAYGRDETTNGQTGAGQDKGKMPVRQPLQRMESEMSEATIGPGNYAHLDSDEE